MKIFDEYNLKARVFPVTIVAFPILIFLNTQLVGEINLLEELLSLKIVGQVSLSVALLWFVSMGNREVSKVIEKAYYGNPRVFPTTYLMLYANSVLSEEMKDHYRILVNKQFSRNTPSREFEHNQPEETKKQLGEIAQLVLNFCHADELLFQHNILYGFWRNMISAVFMIFPFVLGIVILNFINNENQYIQICFGIIMFTFILLHRRILRSNAERFANKLFSIFINKKSNERC